MTEPGENSNTEYIFRMAAESANTGNSKKALEYLDQVISANPAHSMAWQVRGNCLDVLGKCDEAIRSYDKAIKLDPYNAEAWFNKGLTLKRLGREKDAQCCMDEAVKIALGE